VRVKLSLLLAAICALWTLAADAQLTANFRLDKTTFSVGEPVFLYFELVNHGPTTAMVLTAADPEQPFCSGHVISVSNDPPSTTLCPGVEACIEDGPLAQLEPLLSGHKQTSRFLLNFHHEINAAGRYWVEAKHLHRLVGTPYQMST